MWNQLKSCTEYLERTREVFFEEEKRIYLYFGGQKAILSGHIKPPVMLQATVGQIYDKFPSNQFFFKLFFIFPTDQNMICWY
jgi:hypothetical protein